MQSTKEQRKAAQAHLAITNDDWDALPDFVQDRIALMHAAIDRITDIPANQNSDPDIMADALTLIQEIGAAAFNGLKLPDYKPEVEEAK